jgi:hypothetical protein
MDNVRHLPPNESPEAMLPELTENEKRVTGLLARGRPLVEIASEMAMSFDEALELVLGVFMKLKPASFPSRRHDRPQRPLRSPYLSFGPKTSLDTSDARSSGGLQPQTRFLDASFNRGASFSR